MIVAGAGIIGLACAWRLAQNGIRVTVFDAREAGAEASWAGAGMLAPGGEIDAGSELASLAIRSAALYPDFVAELEATTGMRIDFQRCGAFEIAQTAGELEALRQRSERQRAIGIESEFRQFGEYSALFYPGDAIVDSRQVTAALRCALLRSGGKLREHEPVIEVAPAGSWVRTRNETIRDADGVLISAGAWSSQICAVLPEVKPVRGHLVSWNMPPGTLPSILRHGHTYLLQRRNGMLIAGSSTEDAGFDRKIDRAIMADIQARAAAIFPAIAAIEPADCWNGFRPAVAACAAARCAPVIGRQRQRLWAACGHYRNGILLAPETARLIAESVAAEI